MHSTVQTTLFSQNVVHRDHNNHYESPSQHLYGHSIFQAPPHHIRHSGSPNRHGGSNLKLNEQHSSDHNHHHHHHHGGDDTNRTIKNCDPKHQNDSTYTDPLFSNGHQQKQFMPFSRKFDYFCQCAKPCGILTLIIGILLLSFGIFGILFSQLKSICELAQLCSSATLKIISVILLVISIVIILIGSIVIIYSKRDRTAKIIVTSTKHLDNLDVLQQQTQSQTPLQPHKKHINLSTQNLSNLEKGLNASQNIIPQSLSSSNLIINSNNNNNQAHVKHSSSVSSLTPSISNQHSNSKTNINKL